jgi:hypothetical protein
MFCRRHRLGHDDALGDRIIGSFANADILAIDRPGKIWMVTGRAGVDGSADLA